MVRLSISWRPGAGPLVVLRAVPMALAMVVGVGSGCSVADLPTPRPPEHRPDCGLDCLKKSRPRAQPQVARPVAAGELDLRRALRLALTRNTSLKVAERQRCVRAAALISARRFPNPEIHVDVEDWLGSGDVRGVREMQLTIQVSQDIPLGRRRSARLAVARLGRRAADWAYQEKRLEVLAATTRAFVAVLHAQMKVRQVQELVVLARQVVADVKKRVDAGRVQPEHMDQARVQESLASLELTKAQRRLTTVSRLLALQWGSERPDFARVTGRLVLLPKVPALSLLRARLNRHPSLARGQVAIAEKRARMTLESASAYPDLSLRAGYRYMNGGPASAVVVGLSIPLPFFSRNRGAVAVVRQQLARARLARRADRMRLVTELTGAHARLRTARTEAETLRTKIQPLAQRTFGRVQQGYQLGRRTYLEVLTAQRTVFDVRQQYLEALSRYHLALVDVKVLVGDYLTAARGRSRGAKGTRP